MPKTENTFRNEATVTKEYNCFTYLLNDLPKDKNWLVLRVISQKADHFQPTKINCFVSRQLTKGKQWSRTLVSHEQSEIGILFDPTVSSSKQIKTKHASSSVIDGLNNFESVKCPVKWPRSDYFVVCECNWIGRENTRKASLRVKDLFHQARMDIDRLWCKTSRWNSPLFALEHWRSSTRFQFLFFSGPWVFF